MVALMVILASAGNGGGDVLYPVVAAARILPP